jgi:hypothetical protein
MIIPEAMIEAGAKVHIDNWDTLPEEDRDLHREGTAHILVAALGVCEVREEWRAKIADGSGDEDVSSDWFVRREEVDWWLAVWIRPDDGVFVTVESRLVIITPPAAIPQPERTAP